MSHHALLRA